MGGVKTGYFGRFNTSPVTGSKNEVVMGLYMVKITLVFDFVTRGVGNEDRKGVGPWVYKGCLVIDDPCGPEIGEPIIRIFLAVGVDELRCDTRD
jgi:hypothetical protein